MCLKRVDDRVDPNHDQEVVVVRQIDLEVVGVENQVPDLDQEVEVVNQDLDRGAEVANPEVAVDPEVVLVVVPEEVAVDLEVVPVVAREDQEVDQDGVEVVVDQEAAAEVEVVLVKVEVVVVVVPDAAEVEVDPDHVRALDQNQGVAQRIDHVPVVVRDHQQLEDVSVRS